MRTLTWFWFLPLCLCCGYAFVFSPVREKVKEPQGKVPCGGHFRIRQNLPEHAPGWLGSKWLWLFFVVALYAVLKFRGDSEKSKVRTAPFPPPLLSQPGQAPRDACASPYRRGLSVERSRLRGTCLVVL